MQDSYYLANLISTGRLEGNIGEVLGTVPDAIDRTIEFIDKSDAVYSHQAEIFTRNLVYVVEKEKFSIPLEELLAPFERTINEIATGNL